MRRIGLLLAVAVLAGPADAQPGKKARPETQVGGRPVSAWVKDLEGGKAEAVVPALNALMRAGPEARTAVPALVKLIEADAGFVPVIAVLTLAKIGPDAGPALRKALAGPSPRARERSARALGLIGDPAAVTGLVAALSDGEAAVRRAAAASLGQLKARSAAAPLKKALADKDAEARVEAAAALWQVTGDVASLGTLQAACKEKDEDLLTKALTAMTAMGPKAAAAGPVVAALLKHESTDVRFLAAQTHHRITGAKDGLSVVIGEMTADSHDIRLKAAAALAAFADMKEAQVVMPTFLLSRISGTPEGAVALRRETATYAPARLMGRMAQDDPDPAVRWWSALALLAEGKARRDEEDGLILTLRDVAAADAVLSVVNRDRAAPRLAALLTGPARLHAEAARALAMPGMDARPALDALLEKFADPDKMTRRAAAEAVAGVGPEVLPRLRRLVSSDDARARESAARAAGRIGVAARSLTPALAGRLRDPESAVRAQAALALWSLEGESELPLTVLDLVLKDVDNQDRWEAVEAIGVIASEARPAIKGLTEVLVNSLKDRDPRVRVTAAKWLFRRVRQSKPVMPLLRDAMGDRDELTRRIAAETLGELDAEANPVPPLLALLEDRDAAVRLAAAEGLTRHNDRAALLKALAGPKRVRDGARWAFVRLGLGRAAAEYVAALEAKDDAAVKRLAKGLAP